MIGDQITKRKKSIQSSMIQKEQMFIIKYGLKFYDCNVFLITP